MLTVTEPAAQRLSEVIQEAGVPEQAAIRLVYDGQRIGMQPDEERPGDTSFEHDGRTILVLDEQVATLLSEHKLDVQQGELALQPASQA